jgi:F like protein
MRVGRSEQLQASLIADGLAPAMATAIARRLGAIAKRRRQAKMKRINRERSVIKTGRADTVKVLTSLFNDASADIAKQITAARKALGKADAAEKPSEADVDAILAKLDFSAWGDAAAELEKILLIVSQDGIGAAFDQIGFDAPANIVDQVNAAAVAWAKARSAELVGKSYDADGNLVDNPDANMAITESTRDMVRADVAQAIEDGTSTSDLADQLADSYALSDDRAEAIARFEIAQADVEGNLSAYRESGVVSGKEWVLGSEHDEDDECDDAAAMGVVPLDSDFGGQGNPPAHPNCVCDVLPVLAD